MSLLADAQGNLVEVLSFDAWGRRRSATDWGPAAGSVATQFRRGFTGHEHIDLFSLVNMNGRVFDPVTARFLSPDPIIQEPTDLQSLNRYSYCFNNPLSYIDPSGNIVWFVPIIAGAVIGGGFNLWANRGNIGGFWQGVGYFAVGAAAGGLSVAGGLAALPALTTSLGAFGGAVAFGGLSGGISGFGLGLGNTLMQGGAFFDALGQGLLQGAIGLGVGMATAAASFGLGRLFDKIFHPKPGPPQAPYQSRPVAEPPHVQVELNKLQGGGVDLDLGRQAMRVTENMANEASKLPSSFRLNLETGKVTVNPNTGSWGGVDDLVRVRHHTSSSGLSGIKNSGSINASRGIPYGVDVEVVPFVKPSQVNMGQAGRGSFVEFSVPRSQLSPIPGYMGGTGNSGRIVTGGSPLNIRNANPKFSTWKWWPW